MALPVLFLVAMACNTFAATLRLGDPVAAQGGQIRVPVLLEVQDYESVAGVQFALRMDGSGYSLDGITGGGAAQGAGKTPSFRIDGDLATIIVAGMNLDSISSGTIAYIALALTSDSAAAGLALENPVLSGPTGSRVPARLENTTLSLETDTDKDDDGGTVEGESGSDDESTGGDPPANDDGGGTQNGSSGAKANAYNAFGGYGGGYDGGGKHASGGGAADDGKPAIAAASASGGMSSQGAGPSLHAGSGASRTVLPGVAPPPSAPVKTAPLLGGGHAGKRAAGSGASSSGGGETFAESRITLDSSEKSEADAHYLSVSGGALPGISRILVRRIPAQPNGMPVWQILFFAAGTAGFLAGGIHFRKKIFP